ncbi:hypothetical protein Tco_1292439 [Tanacetum coccineum]
MKKDPETPLLVGRGFLATANAVIDCKMAKIAVGEGITRLVFRVKGVDLELLLGLKRLQGFLEVTTAHLHNGNYAKSLGSTSGIRAFALRNFDLEVMEFKSAQKAMLAIDGAGFDWSDMAEEQVQTNMALMAFSDSELNQTEFTVATYKRGLATVEEQVITYRKNEVLFSKEVAVLKREVTCKDYEIT